MARLALMVIIVCLAIPLTLQRSCTLVVTGELCLKECCGKEGSLYCLDSCVDTACSSSEECDSSCCRNGRSCKAAPLMGSGYLCKMRKTLWCTNNCLLRPPPPQPPKPEDPSGKSSKRSSLEWWKVVPPIILLALIATLGLAYKFWWLRRVRRLLTPPSRPANVAVFAVVSEERQLGNKDTRAPPPYQP